MKNAQVPQWGTVGFGVLFDTYVYIYINKIKLDIYIYVHVHNVDS